MKIRQFEAMKKKIKWILRLTENSYFNNKQEPFNASRLGEPKPGYNRVLKVVLPSIDERNEFLKNEGGSGTLV